MKKIFEHLPLEFFFLYFAMGDRRREHKRGWREGRGKLEEKIDKLLSH